MYPNIYLDDVDIVLKEFQTDKFFYDIEDFKKEDCHYMLVIDPVNDISDNISPVRGAGKMKSCA